MFWFLCFSRMTTPSGSRVGGDGFNTRLDKVTSLTSLTSLTRRLSPEVAGSCRTQVLQFSCYFKIRRQRVHQDDSWNVKSCAIILGASADTQGCWIRSKWLEVRLNANLIRGRRRCIWKTSGIIHAHFYNSITHPVIWTWSLVLENLCA